MSPDAKPRSFSLIAKFVAYDPHLISPKKANGLIKTLRQALKDFKLVNGYISAYILVIDEFNCEQINTNLLRGSWKIRVELLDKNEDGGAVLRFNNFNDGGMAKAICALRFVKYQTIIKIVEDYDNVGNLTIENPVAEPPDVRPGAPSIGNQKYNFYERFSKSVAEYSFIARVLILEKELARLKNDISLTDEAKKHLMKKASTSINSLKQNMSDKEQEELVYIGVSLDLIPSI